MGLGQKTGKNISHKGGIDNLQPGQFSGWVVADGINLNEVRLLVGDHLIARGEINQQRADVNDKLGYQGAAGFTVELPTAMPMVNWQGSARVIALSADGSKQVELGLLGKKEQTGQVFKALLQSDLLGFIGHCDGMAQGEIRGWACRRGQQRPAQIWLQTVGEEALQVTCDKHRGGLETMQLPSKCGFSVDVNSLPPSWHGKEVWCSFDKGCEYKLPQPKRIVAEQGARRYDEKTSEEPANGDIKIDSRTQTSSRARKQADITSAASLYRLVQTADLSRDADECPIWLPTRIMQDADSGLIFSEHRYILQSYMKSYHSTGKNTLDYLNSVSTETIERVIQPYFDCAHYAWEHPDIASEPPHKALHHYAVFGGHEEARSPNPLFCNQDLYQAYPWTKDARINVFYLFIRWPEQFPIVCQLIQKRFRLLTTAPSLSWPQTKAKTSTIFFDKQKSEYQRVLAITREVASPKRLTKTNDSKLNIHFVIPDFTVGSGGHMTIFRFVLFLERAGHSCTIWIKDYCHERHPLGPETSAQKYLPSLKSRILPLSSHFAFANGDALIATSWDTVRIAINNLSFHEHFYLVQDYEPLFYARGSEAIEAEDTYRSEIKTICAGSWLHQIMATQFGKCSTYFDLSYDREVYQRLEEAPSSEVLHTNKDSKISTKRAQSIIRLAFYARLRTARRAVELALKGLALLKQDEFILCVEMFGEEEGVIRLPSNVIGHDNGILSPSELAELYNSCDIGLTFSTTNYALVPQEMMACGLPVIEIDNESTRAIYPEEILTLAKPSAEGIASSIEELALDPFKRKEIAARAEKWVKTTSWQSSFEKALGFLQTHIHQSSTQSICHATIADRYLSQPHTVIMGSQEKSYAASVVIPVYQGGDLLQEVVKRVQSQAGVEPFEIILIDSSSTDGSISKLCTSANLSVIQIAKRDFQHGRTRNLGIAISKSPYVAFLTQDAVPADVNWLSNLIKPLILNEEVDAVFGCHQAHAWHPAHLNENLASHFKSFCSDTPYTKFNDLRNYYGACPSYRQLLHFYSDNNACLRKEAWSHFPYHDVPYGEDQLWADWIIQIGRSKAYADDAVVFHSHNYTALEEYERSATESFYFMKYFGYWLAESRLEIETSVQAEAMSIIQSAKTRRVKPNTHLLDLIRAKREGYSHGCEQFNRFMQENIRAR